MKIAIVGAAGRMGRMLEAIAPGMGFEVVARIDVAPGFDSGWGEDAEGVVDFSFHAAVPAMVAKAAEAGLPYVLGTTGLSPEEQKAVDEAAKKIPVVQSGNYSLGVNLLQVLTERAAAALGEAYDVEICETHHRHKKDAPSGTALMLAKAAAAGLGRNFEEDAIYGRHGETGERPHGQIAIHALRGGSVVGDHTVMFMGELERIELTHRAQSREAFAAGALAAVKWAKGRSAGRYTMRSVLGF